MILQLSTTIPPLIMQFPFMNWPEILDMLGEAYNIPDLARLLFNAMGLQLIQQGMAPGGMASPMLGGMMPPGASGGMQLAAMGAPMNVLPKPASGGGQGPRGAAAGPASGPAGGGGSTMSASLMQSPSRPVQRAEPRNRTSPKREPEIHGPL